MAEHYLLPRQFVKRHPWVHRAGQRGEAALIAAALGLLRRLPRGASTRLAQALFASIGPFTETRRKVEANLRVAFPEHTNAKRRRLVRRIFGWFGVSVAELARLDRIAARREQRIEFVREADFAFLRGAPAVFVTAHTGPWSLTNFLPGHFGVPLSTVYAPESNPFVRRRIEALRAPLPCRFIPRDNSMRELVKELAAGRSVGLGSDVRLDSGPPLPFFGHDMHTNIVPARLALRFDCELVPVRAQRLPRGRFRVTACRPVVADDPSAPTQARVLDMSAKLNRIFEQWIREAPEQWMCFARRWPKDVERAAAQNPAVGGES